MPDQFANPANPEIHRRTTAEEIWNGHRRAVDILVSGVGTGGTITGVAEVIKARKPLSGGGGRARGFPGALGRQARSPQNPGHRRGVRPGGAEPKIMDEIITVANDRPSRRPGRWRRERESSAASPPERPCGPRCRWRRRPESKDKTIVGDHSEARGSGYLQHGFRGLGRPK